MRHINHSAPKRHRAAQTAAETRRSAEIGPIALSMVFSILIFALSLASAANAALTGDQKQVLEDISNRMNETKTLSGDFIQTGPNGDTVKGEFFLNRPGQIRFKYEAPAAIDIIADGKSVAIINTKLETQDLLPIRKTPLRYLLRNRLNLNRIDGVKNVGLLGDNIVVVIEDPEAFNESQLRLFFRKDTYELEQWIVTDAQGLDTSVQIFNTKTDGKLQPDLFTIKYPGQ